MNNSPQFRTIAYSSSAHLCGIDDYHQRLAPHLGSLAKTLRLPSTRVLRDAPLSLLRRRFAYRALSAAADEYDVALLHMVTQWNGFRLGEYLLPTFLSRLRRPLVVVMHEWPEPPSDEPSTFDWRDRARRLAGVAMRQIDFEGLDFEAWVRRVLLQRASHIFVHAAHLGDRLQSSGVPAERITCSMMPVFPIAADPDAGMITKLPRNKRVVLLFGFPHPRKRYDIAVRALPMLPEDVVLLVVGAVDDDFRRGYINDLRQLASQIGVEDRLIVHGEATPAALAAVFQNVAVALAPAGYATGSAALGYLLAADVPVVASDLASVRAVRDAGGGIAIFAADSVTACAETLRHVLDDRECQSELRLRSRRFAETNTFAELGRLVGHRLGAVVGSTAAPPKRGRVSPVGAHS